MPPRRIESLILGPHLMDCTSLGRRSSDKAIGIEKSLEDDEFIESCTRLSSFPLPLGWSHCLVPEMCKATEPNER
jgi:hypothetical protein